MRCPDQCNRVITLACVVRAAFLAAFVLARGRLANAADPWKLLVRAGAAAWPRNDGRKLCTCTGRCKLEERNPYFAAYNIA